MNGELYLVATPIGNLKDLSERARETLATVDLVAAEDTRHTARLLHHFGIDRPLLSLHDYSDAARVDRLLERLASGARIALVSDAGTPLISDPGYELVKAAIESGIRVVPLPGPCAAIAALSVSGLPSDRFVFEGFLPSRREARRSRLEALRAESRTLVFYEAPHRLAAVLDDLSAIFGAERHACIARELTKLYESVYRGTLTQLAAAAPQTPEMQRGEMVLVVAGAPVIASALAADVERVLAVLARELPPAQAAKLAARLTGVPRSELYALATQSAASREV